MKLYGVCSNWPKALGYLDSLWIAKELNAGLRQSIEFTYFTDPRNPVMTPEGEKRLIKVVNDAKLLNLPIRLGLFYGPPATDAWKSLGGDWTNYSPAWDKQPPAPAWNYMVQCYNYVIDLATKTWGDGYTSMVSFEWWNEPWMRNGEAVFHVMSDYIVPKLKMKRCKLYAPTLHGNLNTLPQKFATLQNMPYTYHSKFAGANINIYPNEGAFTVEQALDSGYKIMEYAYAEIRKLTRYGFDTKPIIISETGCNYDHIDEAKYPNPHLARCKVVAGMLKKAEKLGFSQATIFPLIHRTLPEDSNPMGMLSYEAKQVYYTAAQLKQEMAAITV